MTIGEAFVGAITREEIAPEDWPRHLDVGVRHYTTTDAPEPHTVRRRAILAEHPEIRQMYGWNRWSTPPMLVGVVAHVALGAWMGSLPWTVTNVGIGLLLALLVGSVLHHHSSMFIHEASHDNCAPTPRENRFWAMVANISQVIPSAMTFRKYHLRHHAHLGVHDIDGDLPAGFEVERLPRTRWSRGLWVLTMLGFWLARGWMRRTPLNRYEVQNLVLMIVVNGVLLSTIGVTGVSWMLLSGVIGHSFHPVAAHFIHEHYIFESGQETYSYYGVLNRVTYNVGYHVEHHDFPNIPGSRLPELKAKIPQYYEPLVSHRSWTFVVLDFVLSERMGWHRRIVRGDRRGGPWERPETLHAPSLLAMLPSGGVKAPPAALESARSSARPKTMPECDLARRSARSMAVRPLLR